LIAYHRVIDDCGDTIDFIEMPTAEEIAAAVANIQKDLEAAEEEAIQLIKQERIERCEREIRFGGKKKTDYLRR